MSWFKNTYNKVFFGFLLSVLATFFYVRPLHSPWHPFIAGDGLGYYSYLPAKFIHNDSHYDFKWFNRVYDENYVYNTFDIPEKNILVAYGDKKINKYYQGLSYIWFPFFATAHVVAKIFHFRADGFSQPYQLFIGLASLFYLFVGLIFLRKLLFRLFNNPLVAVLVPACIFFGSHLFTFAISANSLSHAYSFTFSVLFIYFLVRFFNEDEQRLRNFLLCFLFLVITGCIRPLNGLIIFIVPAFIPTGFFKKPFNFGKFKIIDVLILLLAAGAIINQLTITYLQTGSLVAYTYTNEKFYFADSKFFEALLSYHMGLFVYVPLMFVSLFGIPFLPKRSRVILPLFFFLIIYLYGAWWYWPILKRALIDFYVLPAIFLAALLNAAEQRRWKIILIAIFISAAAYYQFKNLQMNRGILNDLTTYKEVFWTNFFRLEKTNVFLVPPASIIKQESIRQPFEDNTFTNKSATIKHGGNYSLLLDPKNYISKITEVSFPAILSEDGCPKIRFSFWSYFEEGVNAFHIFIQFIDKNGKVISETPYYLNEDFITANKWDRKEFGVEIAESDQLNKNTVDKIVFTLWNVEGKKNVYIDDVSVDFILTDRSFETIIE